MPEIDLAWFCVLRQSFQLREHTLKKRIGRRDTVGHACFSYPQGVLTTRDFLPTRCPATWSFHPSLFSLSLSLLLCFILRLVFLYLFSGLVFYPSSFHCRFNRTNFNITILQWHGHTIGLIKGSIFTWIETLCFQWQPQLFLLLFISFIRPSLSFSSYLLISVRDKSRQLCTRMLFLG